MVQSRSSRAPSGSLLQSAQAALGCLVLNADGLKCVSGMAISLREEWTMVYCSCWSAMTFVQSSNGRRLVCDAPAGFQNELKGRASDALKHSRHRPAHLGP
jgi:hypothetical protein